MLHILQSETQSEKMKRKVKRKISNNTKEVNNYFTGTIDYVRIPKARNAGGASSTQCYSAYNYAKPNQKIIQQINEKAVS